MKSAGSHKELRLASAARVCVVVLISFTMLLSGRLAFASQHRNAKPAGRQLGLASWYGEQHRGRLMSNGQRFNPDQRTAASWFYPIGTRLRVRIYNGIQEQSVLVTVTDRGPARRLVREGRIIDLSHEAFRSLADPKIGLVIVTVEQAG